MRPLLLLALLGACLALVGAQAPIPPRPDGFRMGGPPCSPVVMEVFIEFLCPDCAEAWPNLKDVVDYYNGNLSLVVHTYPLPYKTFGFTVAQAAQVVLARDPSQLRPLTDFLLSKQKAFYNDAIADMTPKQAKAQLINMISQAGFISQADLKAGLENPAYDWATRVSFKYASSRAVLGTPFFMINGVAVNGESDWGLGQWRQVIDPLLASHAALQALQAPKMTAAKEPVIVHAEAKQEAKQAERCRERAYTTRQFVSTKQECPADRPACEYLPGQVECCRPSEFCIPRVGCRC